LDISEKSVGANIFFMVDIKTSLSASLMDNVRATSVPARGAANSAIYGAARSDASYFCGNLIEFFQRCENFFADAVQADDFPRRTHTRAWHSLCSSKKPGRWAGSKRAHDMKGTAMAITSTVGKGNGIRVVDVMTKSPLSVTPQETVGQADELMTENKIRQLPVVNDGALVGIVTDRDIRSFLSGSLLSTPGEREKALHVKVRDVMTTEPLTVAPDDELQEAVELLIEEKIGGIPVVDEAEGLVGIVTYVDVLRCFLNRLQEE
jgi:CBS domain-containing protein